MFLIQGRVRAAEKIIRASLPSVPATSAKPPALWMTPHTPYNHIPFIIRILHTLHPVATIVYIFIYLLFINVLLLKYTVGRSTVYAIIQFIQYPFKPARLLLALLLLSTAQQAVASCTCTVLFLSFGFFVHLGPVRTMFRFTVYCVYGWNDNSTHLTFCIIRLVIILIHFNFRWKLCLPMFPLH